MKRLLAVIMILLVGAVSKWPIEASITKDRKAYKIGGGNITINMRRQMTQMSAVALLGGFRGVVADFVWIKVHDLWEKQQWFAIMPYFEVVTTLQPMSIMYWETSAWHMAWNISYSVSQDPKEPRAAIREMNRRRWIEEGRKYMQKGLENIPEKYDLYFHLGWLIDQKQDYIDADPNTGYAGKHHVEAAQWFKEAWLRFPTEAPSYVSRMAGHAYMKAGKWQEARDWWCELKMADPTQTKRPDQMWPKIEQWGRECEDHLNLPEEKRCFPPKKS